MFLPVGKYTHAQTAFICGYCRMGRKKERRGKDLSKLLSNGDVGLSTALLAPPSKQCSFKLARNFFLGGGIVQYKLDKK